MRTVLALALLAVVTFAAALPTIPPVSLGSAWTTIQMPDMPLGIAAHDGVLWVCGANEMIASSADGGEHWTMGNEHRNGEMLFTMAFVGAKIEAFGSGGVWLVSDDGGVKWTRSQIQPVQDLETVAFGSDKDVYGANANAFGWSHDGGAHWQFATYKYSGQYGPIAIATLDDQHAALLFSFEGKQKQTAFQSIHLHKRHRPALDYNPVRHARALDRHANRASPLLAGWYSGVVADRNIVRRWHKLAD